MNSRTRKFPPRGAKYYNGAVIASRVIGKYREKKGDKGLPNKKKIRVAIDIYMNNIMEQLIEYGEVNLLNKVLKIERIISRKKLEHDLKWNGFEFIIVCEGEEYVPSKAIEEKIFEKVNKNWSYYE